MLARSAALATAAAVTGVEVAVEAAGATVLETAVDKHREDLVRRYVLTLATAARMPVPFVVHRQWQWRWRWRRWWLRWWRRKRQQLLRPCGAKRRRVLL